MEGSSLGENVATLLQEVEVLQLVTVEVSGHVDSFSSDDHNFVTGEDQLSHDGGEAAQHVAPAIDDNGLRRKAWHSGNNDKFISRNYHVKTNI